LNPFLIHFSNFTSFLWYYFTNNSRLWNTSGCFTSEKRGSATWVISS